jgi:putative phosphonoacetaldehyde dehydrogenase
MAQSGFREEAMRIAGERISNPRVIEVFDPFTGDLVGTVPKGTVEDVRRAFAAAAAYRSPLTRYDRAQILRRCAELVLDRKDAISALITAESGLSRKDTLYEVGRACDVFMLAANLTLRDDGEIFSCDISPHGKKRRIYTQRGPLRAISAITPFNHPLNQVAHKVAPAIATNNKMVLKPSEKTPLTAILLADLLYEAGLPPPMLSVVTGDPREIGDELVANEHVDLVTFTGGVGIGKLIAGKLGYRRCVLELGGNDPLIVMEDADLDEAASLAAAGSYKNSGQRCTAVKRILVHQDVAEPFVDRLVEKTASVRHGDPMASGTEMGTVIDEDAARLIERRVEDAVGRGGKVLVGHSRKGALYAPTVVDRVEPDWELVREETFGPVSPVIRFRDIDEAIRIANGTAYGLSSGVCTNRLDYITRFVQELEVGTVNIREVPGYRIESSPFGGVKDSGLGYKEGVLEAMKSFTNVKTYSLPWG